MYSCVRCEEEAKIVCSGCKSVYYCSRKCQNEHWWYGHKGQCLFGGEENVFIDIGNDDFEKPSMHLFPAENVKKMMVFDELLGIGAGLKNVGNTCYMNSVIQCLTYTQPLTSYLLSGIHKESCIFMMAGEFCFLCKMEEHVIESLQGTSRVIIPREILISLDKFSEFRLGIQEDAHEAFSNILNSMHNSYCVNSSFQTSGGGGMDHLRIEETSLIYQLFGGYIRSQVKCDYCQNISNRYESFLDLNLDLSNRAFSVEDALNNFVTIEELNTSVGYKCGSCERVVSAQKQMAIFKAPNILVLQLKKFDMLRGGVKINKSILFSETIDLTKLVCVNEGNTTYKLYAILVHYGETLYSGHYTTFAKHRNEWFLFDDEKIVKVPLSVVLKQNPYILFYKRIFKEKITEEPKPKEPTTAPSRGKRGGKRGGRGKGKSNRGRGGKRGGDNTNEKITQDESNSLRLSQSANIKIVKKIPHYRVYYRVDEELLGLKDIILNINLPKLSQHNFDVQVSSDGFVSFLSEEHKLDLEIPFALNGTESTATFFISDELLAIVIPILGQFSEEPEITSIDVSPSEEEFTSAIQIDDQHELDVEPILDKQLREKKKSKLDEVYDIVERLNMSKKESTYGNLYAQIENAWIKKGSPKEMDKIWTEDTLTQTVTSKFGRNEVCPCGSGKKYKKCHGFARKTIN